MKQIVKKLVSKIFGRFYHKLMIPKHFLTAIIVNHRYKYPAKNLKVIGVTGTNGKTSTCFLIHAILKSAGYKVGLMTTVAYGVNDEIKPQIAHMTTQPIDILLKRIIDMKKEKIDYLVLEVTSQALMQYRIKGVPIDIAVITNITHEHLDYHKTFNNYLRAKLKLFRLANSNKKGRRLGIINADDKHALVFAGAIKNVFAFSKDSNNDKTIGRPFNLKLNPKGSSYNFRIENNSYNITCNLPGSFNVENSMAAILTVRALGLTQPQIEKGVQTLTAVEGRMTAIEEGQNFNIIVDFAHTPDSFEKLFKDLRPMVKGKIITLFGSAGQRDITKRPVQGQIAAKYSDFLVLTEEDDRDENGLEILNQIASGAIKEGKNIDENIYLILDRTKAIKKALTLAESKSDLVLLLGKGHEKGIIRADGEHDWNEIEITKKLLKNYVKS